MQTDEQIMAAVAKGQIGQLSELYQRYRRPVFGYLVNRGNAPAAAEDLLQTTFERIIKYRTSYRPDTSFKSWVFTIARNAMHDEHQRTQRRNIHNGYHQLTAVETTPAADLAWTDRETALQSQAALAALPANYQEVIDLAWKRNLKYAQIAEVIGTTEANVKVRIHRAVKQLRLNYAKLDKQ